jgi:hypothetical protein
LRPVFSDDGRHFFPSLGNDPVQFLVHEAVATAALPQKNRLGHAGERQCGARLFLPQARIAPPRAVPAPEILIPERAVRGVHHNRLRHALEQRPAAKGLVIRMGHQD